MHERLVWSGGATIKNGNLSHSAARYRCHI
jgi:hypothetical protein